MKKLVSILALSCLCFALVLAGRDHPSRANAAHEEGPPEAFTLNALDYRLNIFDLRQGRHGVSRQYDEQIREYIGDVLFTGQDLIVIENERYGGHFVPLGEGRKPDTEFALFHSLRIYKRTFQVRQFPFLDRHLPYPEIEPNGFFGRIREPQTTVKLALGQVYLLRLFHRTTVGDDRVFLLKVIEYAPGVKVTMLFRELESSREP